MSTANETQVGGLHYRNTQQHWDLAAECELGYFEGQITKYITRHRYKNGKQDVLKAQHFALKLWELALRGKLPQSTGVRFARMVSFSDANALKYGECEILYLTINWTGVNALTNVLTLIAALLARDYSDAGEEAGAGYVNQDR
jgi:hypothetical protein